MKQKLVGHQAPPFYKTSEFGNAGKNTAQRSWIRLRYAVLLVMAFCLLPSQGRCWGPLGHAVIDRTAIDALPPDGPVFLKNYVDYIADESTIPDTWRGEAPFARMAEDPNHVWFQERLTYMHPIPRSRYEYVLEIYRHYEEIKNTDPATAKLTNVRWSGTLPYAAMEMYGDLVQDFRIYRKLKAAHRDTRDTEQTCAFLAVRLGHYIGDGSQPLHTSIQVAGWVGPNPNGYTTSRSIHARFEGYMVKGMKLSEKDLAPMIGPPQHLTGDTFEDILAFLKKSGTRVEPIYQLDKRGAFGGNFQDPAGRAMVLLCTSDGARMFRDLLYRAWLESDLKIKPVTPPPFSPDNPGYIPEIGSAPAAMSPPLDGPKIHFSSKQ